MPKQWYVISCCTSWCNIDEAVISGPYTTKEEAQANCVDTSCWLEFLSAEEAHCFL